MMEADTWLAQGRDTYQSSDYQTLADGDWITRLSGTGQVREETIALLHGLMLRAARCQVGRLPVAAGLGPVRRDEIVNSAADEATLSVLTRLSTFEGRSRFTTWAYKFGVLQAGVEVRRAVWRDRALHLEEVPEPRNTTGSSPEEYAEGRALAEAVRQGMLDVLTPHQRRIAIAVLVEEAPIDVLAERLGTSRGALYKTLHDARKRLRAYLVVRGHLTAEVNARVGK